MAARVVELCELVATYLGSQSYSQTITVDRRNVPIVQTEESDEILVTVFPGEYRITDSTRGAKLRDFTVNVAVQQIVDDTDERTTQDGLLQLVDELEDSLINVDMGAYCFMRIAGETGLRETMFADQTVSVGLFVTMLEAAYVREI